MIDDKALYELVRWLTSEMHTVADALYDEEAAKIRDQIAAITALRARVKELEQHEKNCAELLFERGRLLKHARQVTREQLGKAADHLKSVYAGDLGRTHYFDVLKEGMEMCGLEIVEDAPEAVIKDGEFLGWDLSNTPEGRECGCRWVPYHDRLGNYLDCEKGIKDCQTRCTITEGDE